ncbi:unnamed protein product [Closterium sp. NIES-64]|nr:unnamed protein product [Closterium sp. NIES-64]
MSRFNHIRQLTRLLASLALCVLFCTAMGSAEDVDWCYPTDYLRVSTPCAGSSREVSYQKMRECADPFPVQGVHDEPCSCSPEDYTSVYAIQEGSNKCIEAFTTENCTGGDGVSRTMVNDIYCELKSVACKEEHIRAAYSPCYRANVSPSSALAASAGATGSKAATGNDTLVPAIEVVFYFDSTCNPRTKGSVHLPPNTFIPCDLNCGPGSFLERDTCRKCKPGTYSMGGGLRLERFEELDTNLFTTTCEYMNVTGKHPCQSWRVDAGVVRAGPYDEPNDLYQDECAADPDEDCHNNLKATLSMPVKLVRDGYVKFNYTASAEPGYDGLSFFIDVAERPTMPIVSDQFNPIQVRFNLSRGFHTLTWIYNKDEKWTQGQDTATITFIEVDGTDFNDHTCLHCPSGYFSGEGASECAPCPLDTMSTGGASECTPCPEGTYSLEPPRTNCTQRPPCQVEKHAASSYSDCDATTKTRKKVWKWLEPRICSPTADSPLPPDETEQCPPCPSGQVSAVLRVNNTIICKFCPPGTAKAIDNTTQTEICEPCEPGSVAVKEFSLAHLTNPTPASPSSFASPSVNGLPANFTSGCTGDCGSYSWRMVGGVLDSGLGHGATVRVWLALNVTLEVDGQVMANYTVDIPEGSQDQRALKFFIDGMEVETIQIPLKPTEMQTVMWDMDAGQHQLMWMWEKLKATTHADRDSAVIHNLTVIGVAQGGASSCQEVPEGAHLAPSGLWWEPCPPGTYGKGGTNNCTKCPANTFNEASYGTEESCEPCGEGTSSAEGSSECTVGDVYIPTSFCHYTPPPTAFNSSRLTVFDLSPLARLHPDQMFGPIYDDPTAPDREQRSLYYVSVCMRDNTNATCYAPRGGSLNTYACRVNPRSPLEGPRRRAVSLGDSISLHPLGAHPALERRGFVMSLEGSLCAGNSMLRATNISFICDPDAGYGAPEAWTDKGKAAAVDPSLSFPSWVVRGGVVLPIGDESACVMEMVWYTAHACPMCTMDDYELVEVSGCVDNKYATYKYKQPKTCQANAQLPLPQDIPCQPCTEADYEAIQDSCTDAQGRHNSSHRWRHPRRCNDALPGAAKLPAPVTAGPCEQTIFVISADMLSWQYVFLMALGGVLIVVLSVVWVVTWIKQRRIYSLYQKMVEQEQGDDEDPGEEEGRGEAEMANLHRHNSGN